MTNQELEKKLQKLTTMQLNKETRPNIYSEKLIDQVISIASELQKDDQMHIEVLTQLKNAVDNEIELQQILTTSVLFYSVVLLKETKITKIKARCLDLLADLCQTDRIVQNLINIHQLLKIIVQLADGLYNQMKNDELEYNEEIIDFQLQLSRIVHMMQLCSQKGEQQVAQSSLSVYFSTLVKNVYQSHLGSETQKLLSIAFAVLERICIRKQEAQFIVSEYSLDLLCCKILQDQLNLLNEGNNMQLSDEGILIILNFLATLCTKLPENGINLIQTRLMQTLLGLMEKDVSEDITKFSLSCFIEVLYANKGKRYQELLQALRSIQDPPLDQLIAKIVLFGREKHDSETIGIWSVLIKMIASVPKRDQFVVEQMINCNVLTVCMNQLLEDTVSLQAKSQVFDALDMILRISSLPRQALLNEVSNLISVIQRLKREYQSKRNRNSEYYAEYVDLTEKAKSVLEKLGHTEGRDSKKFQMLTLLITGVAMFVGGIISYPFKR